LGILNQHDRLETRPMTRTLPSYTDLEPRLVWEAFALLAAVPRPSFHEERVRQAALSWARRNGFAAREDSVGNIVVEVPATKGFEGATPVILQGHVDMVCIKRPGHPHDFDRDPIALHVAERDGEVVVHAGGTTLGADNGIGCALAMALALDPEAVHGPVELLLTVNEESGMTGARGIQGGFVRGRYLLNLDTEEDDHLCIGCAGALTVALVWDVGTTPPQGAIQCVELKVSGLPGGHSGMEIHQGRGNANHLLMRALVAARPLGIRLVHLEGGAKRNAIPDSARAIVAGTPGVLQELAGLVEGLRADYCAEIAAAHAATLAFTAREVVPAEAVRLMDPGRTDAIIAAIAALPAGPTSFDEKTPGLVHTSSNPAVLTTAHPEPGVARLTLEHSIRSLSEAGLEQQHAELERLIADTRAAQEGLSMYPPWEPRHDGRLLAVCRSVHNSHLGVDPSVITIHAGLECGLFAERLPGVEMISFGPRIEEAHTPEERVYAASVARCYGYLKAVVRALAEES
jgi:dipeptidase D